METLAVVLEAPEKLVLRRLELTPPAAEDVVVDIAWSGISTGTERLLWSGRMPHFPGMGYPLVPGYESVGRISMAGATSSRQVGDHVFVPGARCFGAVRGLFGGAAARLVVAGSRTTVIDAGLGEKGILLALAATAYHAIDAPALAHRPSAPELIIGHGVLGRLLARITIAAGHPPPVVWERNPERTSGALGYAVVDPATDARRDYKAIYDVSGDAAILDTLIPRLAPGGEIVLAGFYTDPLSFGFAPAFMREARLRVAAEWRDSDVVAITQLITSGALSLDGLITHHSTVSNETDAAAAYRTAFGDAGCLKMVLDWRTESGFRLQG
jgi:3-hydroxyethyl bacteriochlorophyllide a dehydrogenase